MANNYQPSYMQDEEEQGSSQNPLQSQQNQLQGTTAPGSTGQGTQQPASAAGSTSSVSANVGTAPSGGEAPGVSPAAQNKRSSGQFTNLQKFITANKDADLAGKIQGNVQQQQQKAQETLTSRAGDVGKAIADEQQRREGTFSQANTDLERVSQVMPGSDEPAGPTSTMDNIAIASPAGEPLDLASAEQNLTQARDYQFQGPKDIETSDLERERQNLQVIGQSTASEAGRFGLLQQMFGKPSYTSGQQKLDNLLLQNQDGGKEKLADVRQTARGFSSELDKTAAEARSRIAGEQSAAQTDAETFKTATGVARGDLERGMQDRVDDLNAIINEDMATFTPQEKLAALKAQGFQVTPDGKVILISNGQQLKVDPEALAEGTLSQTAREATIGNYDQDALARLNLLNRLNQQTEISAQEGGYGVDKGIAQGKEGLTAFASGTPAQVDTNLQQIVSQTDPATIDKLMYDYNKSKYNDLMPKIQPLVENHKAIYGKEREDRIASNKAAIQEGSAYTLLSPAQQQEINAQLDKGINPDSVINTLYDYARANAAQVKDFYKTQTTAQQTALNNLYQYLRNPEDRSGFDNIYDPNYRWRG